MVSFPSISSPKPCHVPRQSHSSWCVHPSNIWVKIIKTTVINTALTYSWSLLFESGPAHWLSYGFASPSFVILSLNLKQTTSTPFHSISKSPTFQSFRPGVNKSREPGHCGDWNFVTVAPNICRSSVWNLLHVTLPAPRILWWLLRFLENLWAPPLNLYNNLRYWKRR